MIQAVHCIETGYFKLDGGAMFGVVPKTLWNNWNPADANNRCTWAMRSLLISTLDKHILIDTGCGDKQDFKYYDLHGDASLLSSLRAVGLAPEAITDVLLTHLHFDHVGGATRIDPITEKIVPTFPNARYWVSRNQWHAATHPNMRERASFLSENFMPLYDRNVLHLVGSDMQPLPNILQVHEMQGHTVGMWVPEFTFQDRKIFFVTDLIPSAAHIPIPYVMSYDMQPIQSMNEKKRILELALRENAILVFQHDPHTEACTLMMTEKGIRAKSTGTLEALLKDA